MKDDDDELLKGILKEEERKIKRRTKKPRKTVKKASKKIKKVSKKPRKTVKKASKKVVKKVSKKPRKTVKKASKKVVKKVSKKPRKIVKKVSKKPSKVVKKISDKSEKVLDNAQSKSTNVLSKTSKISKNNVDRAGTGISNFDEMIKGGFERQSINLIAGGSGSGKSIFALQFLIEGIRKGETVLYVTFEEKKEEFYENMRKIGLDLEKEEKSGKFIFLEYSPEKVKMMLDEGGGAIETIIIKSDIKRMVIDSITSFSLLFDDDLSKRQATLGLFDIIRKWNSTTLFTVQYDPSDRRDRGISSIEFEADSIIFLYYANLKNIRQRFIEVLKMRGTDHSKEIHEFEIGENGINIGKKATVEKSELMN